VTALPAIDPSTAQPEAAAALAKAKAAFGGAVPNLTRVMANSPAVLHGYLDLTQALGAGQLASEVSERIALLVAEQNGCAYCLSAHTYIAERALGLSDEEIEAAREGDSADPHIRSLLHLASAVNRGRGEVPHDVVDGARARGVSDAEITEVVAHVAANAFTNYLAKAARVDVDFPRVTPRGSAA
jgi:AhpD family alkylhydroperoxidase